MCVILAVIASAGTAQVTVLANDVEHRRVTIDETTVVPLALVIAAVSGLVMIAWKLSSDRKENQMRLLRLEEWRTRIDARFARFESLPDQVHQVYVESKQFRKTVKMWMRQHGLTVPNRMGSPPGPGEADPDEFNGD